MAYQYQTGTANHVIHWFSLLETFLTGIGWIIESGAGSTEIVFSSIGEGGGRTKLFIRFRRGTGGLKRYVYHRVQDDAAGTNFTKDTSGAPGNISALDAPGDGDIPFVYWMAADKDKVIANFKAGAGYTGGYVGVIEPFALSVDEEQQMIAFSLQDMIFSQNSGYVLKDSDGNWNMGIRSFQAIRDYVKDPLDNSVAIFGLTVNGGTNNKIVGQPTDVSGRIMSLPGVNPEDIITTGYTGATSAWIVLGTATNRWCMRTGGVVPTGQLEGAYFAHTNGIATSRADFEAKLLTFMTAIGWTKIANPAPALPIDYFWYSTGESGIDDIYLHWLHNGSTQYQMGVSDDTALTHEAGPDNLLIHDDDWPTYYFLTADRDCLLVVIEKLGVFNWMWAGMYQMFLPDQDSYTTPYKVGTRTRLLRGHDGTWDHTMSLRYDNSDDSSPNLYDGVTNIVWQYLVQDNIIDVPVGICKYVHIVDGPGLSIMDTVAIGGRSFRAFNYYSSMWGLALREA